MLRKKRPDAKADEDLALAYLCGRFKNVGRGETFYFLEPGSLEEKKARHALAGLLRSGKRISRAVRWHLASLIYPETSPLEERRFVIEPAKKGKPGALATHALDINIARRIAERIADAKKGAGKAGAKTARVKVDPIVEEEARYFGVSKSKAYGAYRAHRRRFESPLSVRFSTLK